MRTKGQRPMRTGSGGKGKATATKERRAVKIEQPPSASLEPAETVGAPPEEAHRKKSKPKGTKIETVLALQAQHPDADQQTIAKMLNVSPQALSSMLKRYGINHNQLETFKTNRADIFAGLQEMVASTLSEEAIKKASVRDRTILLGTLYDKERLERGQSTSNQSVFFHIVQEACEAKE